MTDPLRVAVTSTSFAKQSELLAELEALGVSVVANTGGIDLEGQRLADFLAASKAELAIIGREPITDEILAVCPDLRAISKYGVGLDNVDEAALRARRVKLYAAPGTNRRAVAELVLAFALGHVRNVTPSVLNMKQGRWEKLGGRDLSSLTVGIVGFGNTGSELARLLKAFGCTVLFTDLVDKTAIGRDVGARAATYADIVAKADVITFHVPATDATRLMFSAEQISKSQPHALVINTSRGSVVDFDATCRAVIEGRLGGFAADVFPVEPCDVSTWSHPRLYFTPHIGGNSREAVLAMGRAALRHVGEFLKARG